MDKNTITGLILIFLIFIGFSVYNNSRLNKNFERAVAAAEAEVDKGNLERARTEYVNALRFKPNQPDVLEKINDLNIRLGIVPETIAEDSTETETPAGTAVPGAVKRDSVNADQYGAFAVAAKGEDDFITLENNLLEIKISQKGGRVYSARLKNYVTHDSLPLILFSGDSTVFGFNFFTSDNKAVQTNDLYFVPVSGQRSYLITDQPQSVILRLQADSGRYIEYKYTLAPDKYSVNFDVEFRNMEGILPANQNSISLDWRMYIPQQEKGRANEENYTTLKYKYYQDEVDGFRLRSKKETETQDITTKLSWVAYVDQFFSSVIMTDDFFLNGSLSSSLTPTSKNISGITPLK